MPRGGNSIFVISQNIQIEQEYQVQIQNIYPAKASFILILICLNHFVSFVLGDRRCGLYSVATEDSKNIAQLATFTLRTR